MPDPNFWVSAREKKRCLSTPVRLIVHADDLGLTVPVNQGILEAHIRGLVTSTSLMPTGRAFGDAVVRTRETPTLDVGVHLTLVAEEPVARRNTSLTAGTGRFPKGFAEFALMYMRGAFRLADIRAELTAQIDKVLDHGVPISHIDSHQHVHVLPGIREITMELAERYGVRFVRDPCEAPALYMFRDFRSVQRIGGVLFLWSFRRFATRSVRGNGLKSPLFLGFVHGGRLDADGLADILAATRPGGVYELMCHPGYSPPEPEYQAWNYRHEGEMRLLAAPELRKRLEAGGVMLCSFRDLAGDQSH